MARTTLNDILVAVNGLGAKIDAVDKRVCKLENASKPATATTSKAKASSTKKAVTTKGKGNAQPKVEKASKNAVKIADFEPKRGADGEYLWVSYKAQRKAYCVAVATDGKFTDSTKAYAKGIKIDYTENSKYYKAKAQYESKFTYVKKADR